MGRGACAPNRDGCIIGGSDGRIDGNSDIFSSNAMPKPCACSRITTTIPSDTRIATRALARLRQVSLKWSLVVLSALLGGRPSCRRKTSSRPGRWVGQGPTRVVAWRWTAVATSTRSASSKAPLTLTRDLTPSTLPPPEAWTFSCPSSTVPVISFGPGQWAEPAPTWLTTWRWTVTAMSTQLATSEAPPTSTQERATSFSWGQLSLSPSSTAPAISSGPGRWAQE